MVSILNFPIQISSHPDDTIFNHNVNVKASRLRNEINPGEGFWSSGHYNDFGVNLFFAAVGIERKKHPTFDQPRESVGEC